MADFAWREEFFELEKESIGFVFGREEGGRGEIYSCGNVDCSVWDVEVSDYEDESGRHGEVWLCASASRIENKVARIRIHQACIPRALITWFVVLPELGRKVVLM